MKGSGAGSPWAALGGGWVCAAGGLKSWLQAGDLTVVGVPRIRSAARLVLAMRPQQAPVSGKVFIQRDYSSGTRCQFQTKFPAELENRVCILGMRTQVTVGDTAHVQIDRQQFEETVRTLNNLYAEAEKLGGQSYLEGCLACLTAYTIFLCMETHYEKVLKKVSKYIQEQNEKIYAPQGLLLTDPIERGLRVIEITIYEDRGVSSGR
uniref:Golgin subfamily A member 7 n=1 Tax=Sus scrofa TaxID=9823 RepID=A0A8D1AZ58_PIG